jgi:hypothetical protein
MRDSFDLRGFATENWVCIDCGINTAPGVPGRVQLKQAMRAKYSVITKPDGDGGVIMEVDHHSEVYMVRDRIWQAAGMEGFGGCLCIGCLEQRIGRMLTPKDFNRKHPFATMPGTERLLERRDGHATD